MSLSEVALGDILRIKHGFAFKGEHFGSEGEFLVVTPGNFHEEGGFRRRVGKDRYYTGDIPESFIFEADDLIIAMTEQGEGLLGSSALVPETEQFLHNQRIGLVHSIDVERADKGFLFYLFNTRPVRSQIRASASGTKVRHTAPERIYRVKVSLPSLPEQQCIASILSGYDDLIENNRRRIALLEETSRQLYKEWFVRFRFPGHEHVKIIDGVPKGWTVNTIDEVCQTIGGGTPSTQKAGYWDDGDVLWFTPTDVTRNSCLALLNSETKISESGLNNSSAKIIPAGSILMTSRASVGFFGINRLAASTNQGFINIVANEPTLRMYLLQNLMWRVEEIRSHAGGATYKEISKGRFRALPILMPPLELAGEFEDQMTLLHTQVETLHIANQQLTKARDLLLPKLISGAISV
ncbi:MAG: restriction endonuclease subunit S [Candidatus Sphingomonas colombiensis]|nr:restriction endonuclease subunit S [Sphingomonas sp.]WEK44295.1 MAG: restriction endonuclease subunit S [Sphingomonas sp.]